MLRDNKFSPSSSPIATYMGSYPTYMDPPDTLDDIFGSAPPSPSGPRLNPHDPEPSDIPRLRSEHSTAGYRDGLGVGKAETMQAGFDEGYSLSAVMGLRVGNILGILEGIESAVGALLAQNAESSDIILEKERISKLVRSAREELKTESFFSRDFWGPDGIWKFPVKGDDTEEEVLFGDVANAHPFIQKWEKIVAEESARWSLDLKIMEREEVARLDNEETGKYK